MRSETKNFSLIRRYKLQNTGTAYTIVVPSEWLKAHNIDLDKIKGLLLVCNKDIRIVNPNYEDDVHEDVHKMVQKAPRYRGK